jgi:hypothetical protein
MQFHSPLPACGFLFHLVFARALNVFAEIVAARGKTTR